MPNAIDATDAQINIAKFNQSATVPTPEVGPLTQALAHPLFAR
jgi:hypothetical protein